VSETGNWALVVNFCADCVASGYMQAAWSGSKMLKVPVMVSNVHMMIASDMISFAVQQWLLAVESKAERLGQTPG